MSIKLLSERLLKNDETLTWLSLTNNEIGTPLPELTQALLRNNTLRKVSCHAGFLGSLAEEDLALLLETLSQLSHLQDVWLALPTRQAWRSSSVLKTILGSPKMVALQKLTLRGMDDNGCQVLSEALLTPGCSLTDLQIRGTTSSSSPNNSNGNNNAPSRATKKGILDIAEMIKVNRTLERLDLCYKGLDMESCQAMAQALEINQKLQKLDLSIPTSNNPQRDARGKASLSGGMKALAQSMRKNFSLVHLNTPAEGDSKTMMDLFTKLNRTGVRALMRNATAGHTGLEDVLEVLQDNNKDITPLYEILALHPALWDPAKANVKGLASNEQETQGVSVKRKKDCDNAHNPSDTKQGPSNWNNKKLKPVMARWDVEKISTQEREKVKNFKRWTPTIVDHPVVVVQPRPRSARRGREPVESANATAEPSSSAPVVDTVAKPVVGETPESEKAPAKKQSALPPTETREAKSSPDTPSPSSSQMKKRPANGSKKISGFSLSAKKQPAARQTGKSCARSSRKPKSSPDTRPVADPGPQPTKRPANKVKRKTRWLSARKQSDAQQTQGNDNANQFGEPKSPPNSPLVDPGSQSTTRRTNSSKKKSGLWSARKQPVAQQIPGRSRVDHSWKLKAPPDQVSSVPVVRRGSQMSKRAMAEVREDDDSYNENSKSQKTPTASEAQAPAFTSPGTTASFFNPPSDHARASFPPPNSASDERTPGVDEPFLNNYKPSKGFGNEFSVADAGADDLFDSELDTTFLPRSAWSRLKPPKKRAGLKDPGDLELISESETSESSRSERSTVAQMSSRTRRVPVAKMTRDTSDNASTLTAITGAVAGVAKKGTSWFRHLVNDGNNLQHE